MPALETTFKDLPHEATIIPADPKHFLRKEEVEESPNQMKLEHRERVCPTHFNNGLPNIQEGYGHCHPTVFRLRAQAWEKRLRENAKHLTDLYGRLNEQTRCGLGLLERQEPVLDPAEYIRRRQRLLQSDPAYFDIMEIINGEEAVHPNAGPRSLA